MAGRAVVGFGMSASTLEAEVLKRFAERTSASKSAFPMPPSRLPPQLPAAGRRGPKIPGQPSELPAGGRKRGRAAKESRSAKSIGKEAPTRRRRISAVEALSSSSSELPSDSGDSTSSVSSVSSEEAPLAVRVARAAHLVRKSRESVAGAPASAASPNDPHGSSKRPAKKLKADLSEDDVEDGRKARGHQDRIKAVSMWSRLHSAIAKFPTKQGRLCGKKDIMRCVRRHRRLIRLSLLAVILVYVFIIGSAAAGSVDIIGTQVRSQDVPLNGRIPLAASSSNAMDNAALVEAYNENKGVDDLDELRAKVPPSGWLAAGLGPPPAVPDEAVTLDGPR